MLSVTDLVNEIEQCSAYVQSHVTMGLADFDLDAMQTSLATSMATDIGRLRFLNADGPLRLTTVLASSGYLNAGRSLIANASRTKHESSDAHGNVTIF